ncbi:hypothetical protein [Salinibaculum rarum]|uniref:hypothetical protein n=1 Tax=Salinibaculum rarum TaxID=3058903 RepID=UPI00265FDF74|nr:hypothetical protein [Salinibaculum sp. KK48]
MQTRRTLLSRVVSLAIGGSVVGQGVARGEQAARSDRWSDGTTTLTVEGAPSVLAMTGVPRAAAHHLTSVRRQWQSVSLSDIDYLGGTVQTRNGSSVSGSGAAVGSFDVQAIARELRTETAFQRVERGQNSDGTGRARTELQTAETPTAEGPPAAEQPRRLFARSTSPAFVALGENRINVACGDSRERAETWLTTSQNQFDGTRRRGETRFGSILDGDVVAQVSLGEALGRHVATTHLEADSRLEPLVRNARTAGVAAAVGEETTTVRYALSIEQNHETTDALAEMKADLRAHDGTETLDEHVSGGTVVADIDFETDALWTVHSDLFEA